MAELVHPEVEIHTDRVVHRGRPAAVEWAGKAFDHLERRYEPVAVEPRPGGVAVRALRQYAWRDSGAVGDESEVLIELGIRDGLISTWHLFEHPDQLSGTPTSE